MILAGDVGGTKTHLGIFKQENDRIISLIENKYESQQYDSFESLINDFLAHVSEDNKIIDTACFGIAGPIEKDQEGKCSCQMTNIKQWPLMTETNLSKLIKEKPVFFLNDMEAIAYGISQLGEQDLEIINQGKYLEGNRAIIAAGTGLGKVKLPWKENEHYPSASEGGHVNFAPSYDKDNLQLKLLSYLQDRNQGNVSIEQILSGNGLINIYQFLTNEKDAQESEVLIERMKQADDVAQVISESALAKEDALCEKALDLFVSIYGSVAGDLALHDKTVGGIYIGGGIAPKILEKMRDANFMRFFTAKDTQNPKFAQLNADIPVKVIMNDKVGLLGAAGYAAKSGVYV
ncbi:glucokinase [Candidatus Marithrix sp. Canyon 246]|uniref:glucokinase n=1 Tax=Candidatus Marithrix sp. Canyon 246 TaxID=1827136 RepID=UPI00084A18E6|nr:glucokinase [Candidatus Marithrix sp. Canyon 246]